MEDEMTQAELAALVSKMETLAPPTWERIGLVRSVYSETVLRQFVVYEGDATTFTINLV